MVYSDEEIFIPEKDEEEPARALRMIFRDREGSYKELTVMTPTIEKDDLQEAEILWWIVYLGTFSCRLTILLINILVLHRTLRPLHALLRWLDGYRVGGKNAPLANDTKIAEFRRLNEAAIRNAERAEALFDRQKQFIGQCVARNADAAGGLPQPAGDARRRRLGAERGAVGRDHEGAAARSIIWCGSTVRCCCCRRRSRTASSPKPSRSISMRWSGVRPKICPRFTPGGACASPCAKRAGLRPA